jgi:outer membrane protein insertion porin family
VRILIALALAVPAWAFGLVMSSLTAEAQSAVIREIAVSGNRRVEPETVRSYLRFNVGDAYDAGKVDASIRALFATGLFSDVRITRTANGVAIAVTENPVVNQVAFEGTARSTRRRSRPKCR